MEAKMDVIDGDQGLKDISPHKIGGPEPVDQEVKAAAERIRSYRFSLVKNIIAIGRDLLMVKEKLGHGRFGTWLEDEVGWSVRTAQNYMRAAEALGPKTETVALLPPASLYRLAAKSTPKEVRDDIVNQVMAGKLAPKDVGKALTDMLKKEGSRDESGREQEKSGKAASEEGSNQEQKEEQKAEQREPEAKGEAVDHDEARREAAEKAIHILKDHLAAEGLVTFADLFEAAGEVFCEVLKKACMKDEAGPTPKDGADG